MPASQPGPQHGGIHRAGQDGIDTDVVRGEFDRHGTGQCQQAAFAGGIGGDISRGRHSMHRGDIDDGPAAGGFEQAGGPA